jgi:NitT/TauT family transport system substrate-binding protein
MSTIRRIVGITIVLAFLLAGCQQASPVTEAPEGAAELPAAEEVAEEPTAEPAAEQVSEPVKVTIAHGGNPVGVDHPGEYLPIALGWYEDEGLDVTLIQADGSSQALQLLVSGDADFVQVSTGVVPLAHEEGIDLVSVYAPITHVNARICVLADSEYQSIEDLVGHNIGVPSATSVDHMNHVRALANQAGIDADTQMTMIPTGFSAGEVGVALEKGEVDALAYWTGFFAGLEIEGFEFRCWVWEPLLKAPGHVVATTREYMEAHPDIVAKVGRSMAKAAVYAFENPEAAVKAYWSVFPEAKPLDNVEQGLQNEIYRLKSQMESMTVEDRPDTRWGWNDPEGWQIYIDFMYDSDILKEPMDASIVFSNDFVAEYNDFDAAAIQALADAGFNN